MTMPNEAGFYRAKIALDNNDSDGVWMPVHVFKQDGELVFTVPGKSGAYSLLRECGSRGIVLEWGLEIEVDPVQVVIDRLEDEVDEFIKERGVIGKFNGVNVTDSFTKKALMGIIIRFLKWGDSVNGFCQ